MRTEHTRLRVQVGRASIATARINLFSYAPSCLLMQALKCDSSVKFTFFSMRSLRLNYECFELIDLVGLHYSAMRFYSS